jgi:hypothetical protein
MKHFSLSLRKWLAKIKIQFNSKYLICVLTSVFACSCASLTKSQLNEIQVFGQLTQNFSAYPGNVVSSYNTVHQQQQLFFANGLPTPAEHYNMIAEASDFKIKSDLLNPKIDLSLKIIDRYAQALILLTADRNSKALDTASKDLGLNLEKLIGSYNAVSGSNALPTGIGGAIGQLIASGGNIYIRKKQAEEVRKIIPLADTIITQMTNNIVVFLSGQTGTEQNNLPQLIISEKDNIGRSYRRFLGLNREQVSMRRGKDTTGYRGNIVRERFASLNDDRECLRLLENLNYTEQLRLQCIAAVKNLRKAHKKLLESVQQKKKLNGIVAEMQYYGEDLRKMNQSIKAINRLP